MSLSPGALKLLGGVGTLLVCGTAGTVVALDSKPDGAPLRPPVTAASAPGPGGAADAPTATPCSAAAAGADAATSGRPPRGAAVTGKPDASLRPILQRLAAADSVERRSIIAALPAAQRLQVIAALRAGAAADGCSGPGATPSGDRGSLVPTVVDVPPDSATPLVVSSVS